MADHRIGKVFVELDLDASRYTKAQQQLLKDATTASTTLEKNFQNLGIKSAAHFDLLRQKINLSYDAIKNHAKSTANDILRAEEAKNAKLKALNDQQLGHHKTTMESMKAGWIAAAAAIGAAIGLAYKAMEYVEMGAKALQAEEMFQRVAESAEDSSERIIAAMRKATVGTIDDSDLMQQAGKGMMLGLSGDAMIQIAEMARLGARVAGVNVKEAIEGITRSVATMMPRALKQYGLALGPEVAIITAAQKAGVEGIDLMALATMNFNIQMARQGELVKNAAEEIQVFKARMHEAKESLGKEMIEVLIRWTSHWDNLVKGIEDATHRLAEFIRTSLGLKGIKGVDPGKWTAEEKEAFGGYATGGTPIPAATAPVKAPTAVVDDLEAKKKAWLKWVKEQTAAVKDAAKTERDILKSLKDENKSRYDTAIQDVDHYTKTQKAAGINELNFALEALDIKAAANADWYAREADYIDAHVKKGEARNAAQIAAEAEFIKRAEGFANQRMEKEDEVTKFAMSNRKHLLDWDLKLGAEQAESRRTQGYTLESIDAATWQAMFDFERLTGQKMTEEQRKNAELTLALFKETAVGGMLSGLQQYADEAENVGKNLENATVKAFKGMEDALVEFCMTGKFEFKDMANSIIRDLVRILIQKQITGQLADATGTAIKWAIKTGISLLHTGGIVGEEASGWRPMPAAVFDTAPRFHSGIGPDERAAVLKKGEGVFTPGQMKALGRGEGGGGDEYHTHVSLTINAMDSRSVTQALAQHQSQIVSMVNQAYNKIGKRGPLGS